ncbi:hypothetical protein LQQ57_27520 (plasmid) [Escherichia coli]|nr:hypothetical protein [Escherichia coli]
MEEHHLWWAVLR